MRTMSTRCPICGRGFAGGEIRMVKTVIVNLPFGLVGISFHESCFLQHREKANEFVRQAVEKAVAFMVTGPSPPPPVIH